MSKALYILVAVLLIMAGCEHTPLQNCLLKLEETSQKQADEVAKIYDSSSTQSEYWRRIADMSDRWRNERKNIIKKECF